MIRDQINQVADQEGSGGVPLDDNTMGMAAGGMSTAEQPGNPESEDTEPLTGGGGRHGKKM